MDLLRYGWRPAIPGKIARGRLAVSGGGEMEPDTWRAVVGRSAVPEKIGGEASSSALQPTPSRRIS